MTIAELRKTFDDKLTQLGDDHKQIVSFCIDTVYMIGSVPYLQEYAELGAFKAYVRQIRGDAEISKYNGKWDL